jgi:tRNA G18 (ribose-2'-O)-methylase SpoU
MCGFYYFSLLRLLFSVRFLPMFYRAVPNARLLASPSFTPKQNLLAWLLAQKAKGYYIVGLEQTSSSISLEELTFPDQPCVLLLGKEKEGIPVEFLQAVDQCVEIPQLGIIRSLNVHVSGAICIWEITKQRLAKGL